MTKNIETDAEFQPELVAADTKLVVVDFYATWYVKLGPRKIP